MEDFACFNSETIRTARLTKKEESLVQHLSLSEGQLETALLVSKPANRMLIQPKGSQAQQSC